MGTQRRGTQSPFSDFHWSSPVSSGKVRKETKKFLELGWRLPIENCFTLFCNQLLKLTLGPYTGQLEISLSCTSMPETSEIFAFGPLIESFCKHLQMIQRKHKAAHKFNFLEIFSGGSVTLISEFFSPLSALLCLVLKHMPFFLTILNSCSLEKQFKNRKYYQHPFCQ